jgi:hypothetical protein
VKKLQILFIIGLAFAVGNAYKHLTEIEKNVPAESVSSSQAPRTPDSVSVAKKIDKKEKEFSDMIRKEAETMSQLNDSPEEVQQRLRDLADKMGDQDVVVLQEKALDPQLNGDERFLSVYILGESKLKTAQESLEAIAATPVPTLKESRLTAQEEIIRGQAIESLREPESIKRVLGKADNKFLADRAQRTLLYREGKVSSAPEKQDQQALGKILEKSTQ